MSQRQRRPFLSAPPFELGGGLCPSRVAKLGVDCHASRIRPPVGFIFGRSWRHVAVRSHRLSPSGRTDICSSPPGAAGGALAVVLIVLGYHAVIQSVRRGYDRSGDVARAL